MEFSSKPAANPSTIAAKEGTRAWDCEREWSKLVAKAWADEKFKRRLLADPAAVLREHGVIVPPGVIVRVAENADYYSEVPEPAVRKDNAPYFAYLPLPGRPDGELSEEELTRVAGGAFSPRHSGGCGSCGHTRGRSNTARQA